MSEQCQGIIIKGIGGFYYVETADVIYECKARGSFRKNKISPLVGDNVIVTINEQGENTIDEILERKNFLIRPPLSNLDRLIIVSSMCDPKPNTIIIDKIIAVAEQKSIEPIIIFTKSDLLDANEYVNIYKNAGFKSFSVSKDNENDIEEIKKLFKNKVSAFTGNSGVGKSTLLNRIDNRLALETGEISKKLGRGRHTTRHVELFKINGGYVADTPGFSSLELERCEKILKNDLPYCFREFNEFLGQCKFNSCAHINDKGCAIVQAVNDGIIEKSRHESYIEMYNDVKEVKQWELK